MQLRAAARVEARLKRTLWTLALIMTVSHVFAASQIRSWGALHMVMIDIPAVNALFLAGAFLARRILWKRYPLMPNGGLKMHCIFAPVLCFICSEIGALQFIGGGC
jgi:hypothetical protein